MLGSPIDPHPITRGVYAADNRDGINGIDFAFFVAAAVMIWGPLAGGAFLNGSP
jgi:hypothetical protein